MVLSDIVQTHRLTFFYQSLKFIVTLLFLFLLSCQIGLDTINVMVSEKLKNLLYLRLNVQHTDLFLSVDRKIPIIFQAMLTHGEINREEDLLTWIEVTA